MEIEKTFSVEYSGKNPWDQYYDNRVSFDSEEEADALSRSYWKMKAFIRFSKPLLPAITNEK